MPIKKESQPIRLLPSRKASEVLDQLLEKKKRQPVAALDIARIYRAMGETDKELDWLERPVEETERRTRFYSVKSVWVYGKDTT